MAMKIYRSFLNQHFFRTYFMLSVVNRLTAFLNYFNILTSGLYLVYFLKNECDILISLKMV